MSLYDGPRDILAHMQQLDAKFGLDATLHDTRNLHGWRAERDWVQSHETGCQNPAKTHNTATFWHVTARILSWTRPFRKAT